MSQKSRAVGWVRDLRKKGITFDKRGRARKGSKYVSDRSLAIHLTKIRGRSEVRETKRSPSTLDKQLDRWGVAEKQRRKATPARVAKLAGVSQKKAKEWIARDGMPRELLDRVAAGISKQRVYPATWKHGRKTKATREEERQLRAALKKFLRARTKGDPKAYDFYAKWRLIKDYLRARLTMKAWRQLLRKVGQKEGLEREGMFSIMRFILS